MTAICFVKGCLAVAGHGKEMKHSAYCAGHQPVNPSWYKVLTGRKQCQCAQCYEVFTTDRTFDQHQVLRGGTVVCKDPRRMFTTPDHRRKMVLTTRGWAKNPDLASFNTFTRGTR